MKKKMLCLVLAAMMIVGLAACGKTEEPAAAPAEEATTEVAEPIVTIDETEAVAEDVDLSEYQFAVVYGGVHPYFEPYEPGAKDAAKALGIPEPFVVSPQNWDQTEQNQVIDGVVAKGAKGIALFPSDAVAGNEQITKLVNAGIPAVALGGSPAEPSDASFCFATDVGPSVAMGTQMLIDKLKENGLTEGNIVHLCSALTDTNTQKRQVAINEVLAKPENKGFVLYQELADTDATEPAEEAISSMYASYIDEVDGIICTGYVNAQVLAKTLMERDEQRVVCVGIDDSQDVLDAIEQGYMYGTMTQNAYAMGYVGIYALKLLKDGYTYKEDMPFFIDSGYYLLTQDLLPEYENIQAKLAQEFVATMKDKYFNAPA